MNERVTHSSGPCHEPGAGMEAKRSSMPSGRLFEAVLLLLSPLGLSLDADWWGPETW